MLEWYRGLSETVQGLMVSISLGIVALGLCWVLFG